jgi:hypothetical protein
MLFLALASASLAADPTPETSEPRGFLLQILDADHALGDSPSLRLQNTLGYDLEVRPTDDGQPPDVRPRDGVYSASVQNRPRGDFRVVLQDRGKTWNTEVRVAAATSELQVRLRLDARRGLEVLGSAEGMATEAAPSAPRGGTPRASGASRPPALLVAGAILAGVGVLALLLSRLLRGRPRPARILGAPSAPGFPPLRVDEEDLEALIAGPLAGRRLVLLSRTPHALAPHAARVGEAVLPEELVAAMEDLAAREGPPVALLVLDRGLLDAPAGGPRLDDLARRVGHRFPLYVLGGPEGWARWREDAEGPGPAGAKGGPRPVGDLEP